MGYIFLSCGTFVFCAWFCQFGLCFRDKEARALLEHLKAKKYLINGLQNGEIGLTYNTRDELNHTQADLNNNSSSSSPENHKTGH